MKTLERSVRCGSSALCFTLEQKPVKNLNLRVMADGSIRVSAAPQVPLATVDAFVRSRAGFISAARERQAQRAAQLPPPCRYRTGDTLTLLGRPLEIEVARGPKNEAFLDGAVLCLRVRDPEDDALRARTAGKLLDQLCLDVFGEILRDLYPLFAVHGVTMPALRIRDMKTRWGTCHVNGGIITLNKRLLAAPRCCIEYVAMHEYCHFIHPNHSREFHDLMTRMMPDWKARKALLEASVRF